MVCPACKNERHLRCPELDRQLTGTLNAGHPGSERRLTAVELVGSALCDCQHKGPRRVR